MWAPVVPPWEVVLRAGIIYLFLVIVLRIVPRKELARYSISDIIVLFLITVTVRRSIVLSDDSLTTAFVGLITIFAIDQILNFLSQLSPRWSDLLKGRRIVLIEDGRPIPAGLASAKMSVDEILSRLRAFGTQDLEKVSIAYLERDGKVTFVFRQPREGAPS